MKKCAILDENNIITHIFTPLMQFGINQSPYPDSVKVVDITGRPCLMIGDEYFFTPLPCDRFNRKYNTEGKRIYIELRSDKTDAVMSFEEAQKCVNAVSGLERVTLRSMDISTDKEGFVAFCNQLFQSYEGVVALKIPAESWDFSFIPPELRGRVHLSFLLTDWEMNGQPLELIRQNILQAKDLGFDFIGIDITLRTALLEDVETVQNTIDFLSDAAPIHLISVIALTENLPVSDVDAPPEKRREWFCNLKNQLRFGTARYYGVFWMIDPMFDENIVGVNPEGMVYSNYNRMLHTSCHYTDFSWENYKLIGKKIEELGLTYTSTDLSELDRYIETLKW